MTSTLEFWKIKNVRMSQVKLKKNKPSLDIVIEIGSVMGHVVISVYIKMQFLKVLCFSYTYDMLFITF